MKDKPIDQFIINVAVSDITAAAFSFNIDDSDFATNQIVLNSLIGTLVKYGPTGRIEPYLASEWDVSEDNLIWTFRIRDSLVCENGEKITAKSFREGLIGLLRNYSKKGSVISFDGLVGWKEFATNGNSEKLGVDNPDSNSLRFKFDQNPEDLLELLRMPYFGYWCSTTVQNSKKAIISSAAYSLLSENGKEVALQKRPEWFSVDELSPNRLQFKFVSLDYVDNSSFSITKVPYFKNVNEQSKFYEIKSPPTRFEGFVLSPLKKGIFSNAVNRRIFRDRVVQLSTEFGLENSFYPNSPQKLPDSNLASESFKGKVDQQVEFALERNNYSVSELVTFEDILTRIFGPEKIKFKLIKREGDAKEFFKKTDSNEYFDARVTTVDIGANVQNFVVKMMFCTKLGVSFPDPSGRMQKLVEQTRANKSKTDQKYIDEFNEILKEDAVVIPLKHHHEKWLISKTIDPKSLPSIVLYPRFELVRPR